MLYKTKDTIISKITKEEREVIWHRSVKDNMKNRLEEKCKHTDHRIILSIKKMQKKLSKKKVK